MHRERASARTTRRLIGLFRMRRCLSTGWLCQDSLGRIATQGNRFTTTRYLRYTHEEYKDCHEKLLFTFTWPYFDPLSGRWPWPGHALLLCTGLPRALLDLKKLFASFLLPLHTLPSHQHLNIPSAPYHNTLHEHSALYNHCVARLAAWLPIVASAQLRVTSQPVAPPTAVTIPRQQP
ncbi:hypothetical protein K431DRAFT_26680 [Polychaeton citri CBS 116435]|uniref:Uncharacterized protein n=1 Tax=Polychaeton citri CBS 116435 TaxID=1314669 RepID=A0A9P4QE09_9PEZI|nr:hypothetical protein K431DRAFT_26680 [Polychaeton citri CBS 116435]